MSETNSVPSTSDARTVNNVVRHTYRKLDDHEKAAMQSIKDSGAQFIELLRLVGGIPDVNRMPSRELSIAQTKIEEAVMWAVKHITR